MHLSHISHCIVYDFLQQVCCILNMEIELLCIYNHFHNILRLFDVLPNFPFTTSEMMYDDLYKHDLYKLPHELPNDLRLRILGSYKISGKCLNFIE